VFPRKFAEKISNHVTPGAEWAYIAWFAVLAMAAAVNAWP
jgi:hypothetical protein